MKKFVSLLAFVALGILAACDSGSTSSNGGSGNASDLVGAWKGIDVDIDAGYIYIDTVLITFAGDGTTTSLTHQKDSSLTTHMVEYSTNSVAGTWKTNGNTIYTTWTYEGETMADTATYSISGTKLTVLPAHESPIVFTRQ